MYCRVLQRTHFSTALGGNLGTTVPTRFSKYPMYGAGERVQKRRMCNFFFLLLVCAIHSAIFHVLQYTLWRTAIVRNKISGVATILPRFYWYVVHFYWILVFFPLYIRWDAESKIGLYIFFFPSCSLKV